MRGVSLEVPAGQFTAIMGPSGSGKSTLMHLLAGLDRPTEGSVEIGGEDITAMSDKKLTLLRRKHIGFVFQAFNLVPTLTAEENVTLPLSIAGRKIDRALGRPGDRARRPRRPPLAPPGRALGRPAAARGRGPRPRGRADRAVRRRAHRQPRLAHRAPRCSSCSATRCSAYGQTIVMVTHDAARRPPTASCSWPTAVVSTSTPDEDEILATLKELS